MQTGSDEATVTGSNGESYFIRRFPESAHDDGHVYTIHGKGAEKSWYSTVELIAFIGFLPEFTKSPR